MNTQNQKLERKVLKDNQNRWQQAEQRDTAQPLNDEERSMLNALYPPARTTKAAPVRDCGSIGSCIEYGDFYKAHAERLAEAVKGMMDAYAWNAEETVSTLGVAALQSDVRRAREALAAWEGAQP